MKSSKVCFRFPEKIVLYSSTKFGILKLSTNILWSGTFYLCFWQNSKQIYRKLQYREKDFGYFPGLLPFARRIVLYLSTERGITKLIFNQSESSIKAFDRIENKYIANSIIREEFFKSSNVFRVVQENFFVFIDQMWHSKASNQYFINQKIRFTLLADFKKTL